MRWLARMGSNVRLETSEFVAQAPRAAPSDAAWNGGSLPAPTAVTRLNRKNGNRTEMQAWSRDEQGNDLSGALYTSVRKI